MPRRSANCTVRSAGSARGATATATAWWRPVVPRPCWTPAWKGRWRQPCGVSCRRPAGTGSVVHRRIGRRRSPGRSTPDSLRSSAICGHRPLNGRHRASATHAAVRFIDSPPPPVRRMRHIPQTSVLAPRFAPTGNRSIATDAIFPGDRHGDCFSFRSRRKSGRENAGVPPSVLPGSDGRSSSA